MNNQQNQILERILDDLVARYSDNIIAIYGIGSYFDDSLPPDWVKNDLDIIVIVKSLEGIPKQDWTDVRYKKKELNGHQVWLGFNTIKAYQERNTFNKESFSNYEWSLIDIRHPENSKLLYGSDVRYQLPETANLELDYDDILSRGLYHLDKSLREKGSDTAMKEFSKGIFKTTFYLCIFLENSYRTTSIIEIGNKLKKLKERHNFLEKMIEFFEESLIFRITGQFKTNFNDLRNKFIFYIFSLLENGTLHTKMNYHEIKQYLTDSFSGFPYLIQEIKKIKLREL